MYLLYQHKIILSNGTLCGSQTQSKHLFWLLGGKTISSTVFGKILRPVCNQGQILAHTVFQNVERMKRAGKKLSVIGSKRERGDGARNETWKWCDSLPYLQQLLTYPYTTPEEYNHVHTLRSFKAIATSFLRPMPRYLNITFFFRILDRKWNIFLTVPIYSLGYACLIINNIIACFSLRISPVSYYLLPCFYKILRY
jgi:hypothetical protein